MGSGDDKAAAHVANVERPAEYMVKCKEFDHCIDLVKDIKVCRVVYVTDPLKMANNTIEHMRGLLTTAVTELRACRGSA